MTQLNTQSNKGSQKGFSLVELLVALALSSILLVGLFQIFDSNRQAFSLQDGVARVQESGRIAMEFLARDIRKAGFTGCAGSGPGSTFTNLVDASKYTDGEFQAALGSFDGNSGIIGFNDVTAASIIGTELADAGVVIGTDPGEMLAGTDALIMQGVQACEGGKVVVGGTGTAQLKIEDAAACGLNQGDIVIVSNCDTAEAFGITNNPVSAGASDKDTLSHGSNLNLDNKLSGTYDDDSYIFRPSFSVFYIGNGASGEPALWMKSLEYAAQATAYGAFEVSEGIEDMQLVFGEDTDSDGTVNRYVAANNVTDFSNVLAVRSTLTARSQLRATDTGDTRVRTDYQNTTAIRNRLN